MPKKASKQKRRKVNKYKQEKEKINGEVINGQFPLNPNNADRISFSSEIGKDKGTSIISNVSYEIANDEEWQWVVRYDDHGGTGGLHRHVRISLKDDSEFKIPKEIKVKGSKQKLFEWAIKDIKRNYLSFRQKFLERCGLDLY